MLYHVRLIAYKKIFVRSCDASAIKTITCITILAGHNIIPF